MIRYWEYDPGEAYYMSAIDRYSEARRPCWRCHYQGKDTDTVFLIGWLDENLPDRHDQTWRFNGGDPYLAVELYDEAGATLFKMVWG
jgi:hypothetical protein